MNSPGEVEPILRGTVPRGAGVWGVRNYHTILEQRAIAGSVMTGGYLAMVVASAAMATAGLLLNSAAVVIGSMCVAPFMAPSRAVCIGGLYRNWRVFSGGLVKQLVGLLVIGTGVAIVMTTLLQQSVDGIGITQEILLRAMPTPRDVVLSAIIAVAAGAAASLALVAHPELVETPWGQVIDAIIGVEIAISLVPPAAVIGIGFVLGTPEHSLNAFLLLLLNVVGLDLVGSVTILAIRGIRRRHLELEKQIRETTAVTLDVVPGFISVGSTVDITLLSEREAKLGVICRRRFGGEVPETLATTIAEDVERETGCRCDVSVEVIPLLTHAGIPR
ncbi:MAG TPA: DUF389 domain-containing protein [Polyangiaceae bacterium]|nr:DUF389 domain-containing protein [Polyangiaceae bacterium]HMR74153.1 DUF389 domain-containing protein [Polyangiaceae bacterium]